jgi:hypothetical protein
MLQTLNHFIMRKQVKTAGSKALQLAEITKELFRRDNMPRAIRCLETAERMLNTGTSETKGAVSNIYLYSVSTFLEIHKYAALALFPPALRREYICQINASGV